MVCACSRFGSRDDHNAKIYFQRWFAEREIALEVKPYLIEINEFHCSVFRNFWIHKCDRRSVNVRDDGVVAGGGRDECRVPVDDHGEALAIDGAT